MADLNALGNDTLAVELGKRIVADRTQRTWSQKQLADGLKLSQGAVSKWESGDNYPSLPNLRRLANMFGWDEATFLRYALREAAA